MESLRQILKIIKLNKLFSFLMLAGLFISTFSISSIIIVGNGAKNEIINILKSFGFGYNSILVLAGPGKMFAHHRFKTTTLKLKDCESLKRLYFVEAVSPIQRTFIKASYKDRSYTSMLLGVYPQYSKYHDLPIEFGRFISLSDIENKSKVCVIGHTVCQKLFHSAPYETIGKFIKIKNVYFKVIGVFIKKGSSKRFDLDNRIFIPLSAYNDILFHINYILGIKIIVTNPSKINEYLPQIREILRKNHNLKKDQIDDFRLITSVDIINFVNKTTNKLTKILFFISLISFIISGLTIMNIMLTIVYKRMKEIGIRRAFGATKLDILLQLIFETVAISLIGGLSGVICSSLLLKIFSEKFNFPILLTYQPFVISTIFTIFVGFIFGFIPAKRASDFDPIKAINSL